MLLFVILNRLANTYNFVPIFVLPDSSLKHRPNFVSRLSDVVNFDFQNSQTWNHAGCHIRFPDSFFLIRHGTLKLDEQNAYTKTETLTRSTNCKQSIKRTYKQIQESL